MFIEFTWALGPWDGKIYRICLEFLSGYGGGKTLVHGKRIIQGICLGVLSRDTHLAFVPTVGLELLSITDIATL